MVRYFLSGCRLWAEFSWGQGWYARDLKVPVGLVVGSFESAKREARFERVPEFEYGGQTYILGKDY